METIEFKGLRVTYVWVDFGYEGDPDVPGGRHHLGWGSDDIRVYTSSGDDIYEYLEESFYEELDKHISEEQSAR